MNRGEETYEVEVGKYERVLEVGERIIRQENVRFASSRGDHEGVLSGYRAYLTCIFEAYKYTVAILDNCNVASEALDKIDDLREAVYKRTLAPGHVARVAVDRKAVDACVDDALYKG